MAQNFGSIQVISAGDWDKVKSLVYSKKVALRIAHTRGDILRVEECPGTGWDDYVQIIYRDGWTRVKKSHPLLVVPLRQIKGV